MNRPSQRATALALLVVPALAASAGAQTRVVEGALVPPDPVVLGHFGVSVALEGDTLVAGAEGAAGVVATAGAAYVFVRSGTSWALQQKLFAADGGASDHFGVAVALSGDTLAVGAKWHDAAGPNAGAVYVYTRSGTIWSLQQKLLAAGPGITANLGFSVALEGDTLVAGAPFDPAGGSQRGAVLVFARSAGTWSEQQKLTASDGADGDWLGYAVALSGDTALAGAIGHDLPAALSGAAYAFVRSGATWSEQQKLSPPATNTGFAISAALAGDLAVLGAVDESGPASQVGAAYVFERSASVWSLAQTLRACDPFQFEHFGGRVATDGTLLVVGADQEGGEGVPNRGALYVFHRPDGIWRPQAKILVPGASVNDGLGTGVALSGGTIAGGAARADPLGAGDAGTAYAFVPTPLVQLGCVGDASCPCGNAGAPFSGCDNAQGTGGARLEVTRFDPDGTGGGTAGLLGCGFPPAAAPTVVAIRSTSTTIRTPFGDGLLCIAPPVVRFGATAAVLGASTHALSHGGGAGTFHYQLWYRNAPAAFCDPAAAFNLSNALSIAWP